MRPPWFVQVPQDPKTSSLRLRPWGLPRQYLTQPHPQPAWSPEAPPPLGTYCPWASQHRRHPALLVPLSQSRTPEGHLSPSPPSPHPTKPSACPWHPHPSANPGAAHPTLRPQAPSVHLPGSSHPPLGPVGMLPGAQGWTGHPCGWQGGGRGGSPAHLDVRLGALQEAQCGVAGAVGAQGHQLLQLLQVEPELGSSERARDSVRQARPAVAATSLPADC